MSLLLQIFIMVDIFVAGGLLALAVQQAYAHMRGQRAGSKVINPTHTEMLPPMLKERMIQESQATFQAALSKSAADLEQDLGTTAGLLDKLVKRLGAEIVSDELERYRVELTQLRAQAQKDMGAVKAEVDGHRAELETQLAKEFAAEKQQLLAQIDAKLGDAVVSFLVEAMQHNIDLGAQEPYLRALLEEHKAEFLKEVGDGSATS